MSLSLQRALVAFALASSSLLSRAVAAPTEATNQETRAGDAHLEHGIHLFETNDLDGALEELEQANLLTPGPDVSYALGQVLRKKGRCDQAISHFRRAVEQSPSEAFTRAAQYQIGRCVVETPALAAPIATPEPPSPRTEQPRHVASVWRDAAGGALVGVGLGAVIAGTAVLARAQVLAADSKDDLSAFHAAQSVPALRIAGGVTLGLGGALVLSGIIRYAVVRGHGR